jgi:hypothetical protein
MPGRTFAIVLNATPGGQPDMVYVTRNPLWWLVGTLLSLAIAAVIWFAIVKPQVDHANRTVDETIHNVQPQINHAQKVADCIQSAAGDVDKIASCNR